MPKKTDWGSVADWIAIAIGLAAFQAALAGGESMPDWYGYVWPILALIGVGAVRLGGSLALPLSMA